MFAQCIPQWCSVDVKDESGELRRGLIRAHVPFQGIVVNFDYPGHHAEFVPFDRCENQWFYGYNMQTPVVALHQRSPDQPWRWYPSRVLAGNWQTYVFVETHFGDEVVREVLLPHRVRVAGRDDRRIVSGREVVKDFHAHATYGFSDWPTFPKNFLDTWDRVTGTKSIQYLFDECVLVYASCLESAVGRKELDEFCRIVRGNSGNRISVAGQGILRGIKRPASDENIPRISEDQKPVLHDASITGISYEIIAKITAYCNVEDQIKFRVVCRLWSCIVSPVASKSEIEIDISNIERLPFIEHHKLATILHQKVTESTNILVLSGGKDAKEAPKIRAVRTVVCMLKAMKLKIPRIVLSGVAVIASDVLDTWYSVDFDAVTHPKWREVCGKLLLRDVVVWLPFVFTPGLRIERESLDVQLDVGAERLLEKWCPTLNGQEMDELEKQVRLKWQRKRKRKSLWMLLTKLQSDNDPNDRIESDEYDPEDFLLDAEPLPSLRKLTVWALKLRCS